MVDEEMKTPMQRANEGRVQAERERIKGSLERRMKSLGNRPTQSNRMAQLSMELKNLDEKELPAEVKALTKKLDQVVNKINKG
jgi:chromosome segregation ATPase